MKLLHKIHITGTLTLETGMHIGGSEVDLDIGGKDNAVAIDSKTKNAFIPGSSLKGKLRDLIARAKGYDDLNLDSESVFVLFGEGASTKSGRTFGKLIVRDSFLIKSDDIDEFEVKAENTIDRAFGSANPRHIERVVKGNSFNIDMILDIYEKYDVKTSASYEGLDGRNFSPKFSKHNNKFRLDNRNGTFYLKTSFNNKSIPEAKLLETLRLGFRLLEHDYLGGSGTRGYGKVSIQMNQPKKVLFNKDGTIDDTQTIDFDFNQRTN